MWHLYDCLLEPIPDNIFPFRYFQKEHCTLVEINNQTGGTISNLTASQPLTYPVEAYPTLSWKQLASLIKSWNYAEASIGAAALNAYYNQPERLTKIGQQLGYETRFDTADPFTDYAQIVKEKKVATIGHFYCEETFLENAKELFILERAPLAGDYPDSACEYILPEMDLVVITGFTLINKTLPRLLELSKNAHVCLTGPSVCMAEALFHFGVNEIAGLLLPDFDATKAYALTHNTKILSKTGTHVRLGNPLEK